jgi:hypothetical protein
LSESIVSKMRGEMKDTSEEASYSIEQSSHAATQSLERQGTSCLKDAI